MKSERLRQDLESQVKLAPQQTLTPEASLVGIAGRPAYTDRQVVPVPGDAPNPFRASHVPFVPRPLRGSRLPQPI